MEKAFKPGLLGSAIAIAISLFRQSHNAYKAVSYTTINPICEVRFGIFDEFAAKAVNRRINREWKSK